MLTNMEKLVTSNFEGFIVNFITKIYKVVALWFRSKKRKKLKLQNLEPGVRVMCAQYCTHHNNKIDYLVTFDNVNRTLFKNNNKRTCYNLGEQFTVLSIVDASEENLPIFPNSKLITLINDQMNIRSFLFSEKIDHTLIEEIFELNTDKFNNILKTRATHICGDKGYLRTKMM